MPNIFQKLPQIPDRLKKEYIRTQTALINTRVKLLCALAVSLYSMSTVLSIVLVPDQYNPGETPVLGALILCSLLVIYLTNRAHTIRSSKMIAFLLITLLLTILTSANLLYPEYMELNPAILYLFALFVVSFTIPWTPLETVVVAFLHFSVFSILFWYAYKFIFDPSKSTVTIQSFVDGVVMLTMAFIVCVVLRKKETARDIENFLLLKEVEEKNKQMQRELDVATRVHKTLIPGSIITDLVDVAVTYLPMHSIGGDYAKFHFIDEDRITFIISDVTGHGVPAALLVNRLHSEFERLSKEGKEPGLLLKELNDFIIDVFEGTEMYLSAFCCMLDFKNMKFSYSNHGHPDQYIYRIRESNIKRLDSLAGLLGISFLACDARQNELDLSKGDKIILFTDGVTETKNKYGEEFGKERLEAFVKENPELGPAAFNRKLIDELNDFKEEDFGDDIFLITIGVKT